MKKALLVRTSAHAIAIAAGLAAPGVAPASVADGSIEALRAQLNELQFRIDQLEKDQKARPSVVAAADAVTKGETEGSYKLPGSDTSFQIGGYLKLDAIFDRDQDLGDTLYVEGLNTADEDGNGSFRFHARESRLYVKTSTPNEFGALRTHLEMDFFGAGGNEIISNSRNFRIRHAYGELGGVLAGQTWSNFMHFVAYPPTVDFDGPVGVSFLRQAQLRYTVPAMNGQLSVSAENPEATGFTNSRDSAPDFTARYSWSGDKAAVEAAALLRRLAYDNDANDDEAIGYGFLLAGNIALGAATKLMGGVIWGDGIGRYIYDASGVSDGSSGIGEAYVDADGKLRTIEAYGFNAAITHEWSERLMSVLSYGQTHGDRPGGLFPTSTRRQESIHFSNFYELTEPVTLGFEVSRAAKELQNGDSGHALRFQASARYSF